MTDYYPLIGKAVAGLEKNTAETRRQLYERARMALVSQLRNINPPLTESEITRERLALEEAIRKVEAEAARRLRSRADVEVLPSAQQEPEGDPEPAVELVSAATADARRRTAESLSNLSERLNQEEHGAQVELSEDGVFRFAPVSKESDREVANDPLTQKLQSEIQRKARELMLSPPTPVFLVCGR